MTGDQGSNRQHTVKSSHHGLRVLPTARTAHWGASPCPANRPDQFKGPLSARGHRTVQSLVLSLRSETGVSIDPNAAVRVDRRQESSPHRATASCSRWRTAAHTATSEAISTEQAGLLGPLPGHRQALAGLGDAVARRAADLSFTQLAVWRGEPEQPRTTAPIDVAHAAVASAAIAVAVNLNLSSNKKIARSAERRSCSRRIRWLLAQGALRAATQCTCIHALRNWPVGSMN